MLFKSLVDEAIERISKSGTISAIRERIKTLVNQKYKFIAHSYHWRVLQKRQEITLVPIIAAGSAIIIKGSYVVTISGYTLTSDLQGRMFRPETGTRWYGIRYVDTSTNQIILESKIVENSGTVSYKIWKRFYRLNSNVRMVWELDDLGSGNRNYVQSSMPGTGSLNPYQDFPFKEAGVDEYVSSYSAGTINLPSQSNILEGTGTSWLDNVSPGDKVTIQAETFHVKRVDSDTRIVLLNYNSLGNNIGGAYSIAPEKPRMLEHLGMVGENADSIVIPIKTISSVYDMVNEELDETELTQDFRETLLAWIEAEYRANTNDPGKYNNADFIKAQAYLDGLKANKDLVFTPYKMFHPTIPQMSGRGEA